MLKWNYYDYQWQCDLYHPNYFLSWFDLKSIITSIKEYKNETQISIPKFCLYSFIALLFWMMVAIWKIVLFIIYYSFLPFRIITEFLLRLDEKLFRIKERFYLVLTIFQQIHKTIEKLRIFSDFSNLLLTNGLNRQFMAYIICNSGESL